MDYDNYLIQFAYLPKNLALYPLIISKDLYYVSFFCIILIWVCSEERCARNLNKRNKKWTVLINANLTIGFDSLEFNVRLKPIKS